MYNIHCIYIQYIKYISRVFNLHYTYNTSKICDIYIYKFLIKYIYIYIYTILIYEYIYYFVYKHISNKYTIYTLNIVT